MIGRFYIENHEAIVTLVGVYSLYVAILGDNDSTSSSEHCFWIYIFGLMNVFCGFAAGCVKSMLFFLVYSFILTLLFFLVDCIRYGFITKPYLLRFVVILYVSFSSLSMVDVVIESYALDDFFYNPYMLLCPSSGFTIKFESGHFGNLINTYTITDVDVAFILMIPVVVIITRFMMDEPDRSIDSLRMHRLGRLAILAYNFFIVPVLVYSTILGLYSIMAAPVFQADLFYYCKATITEEPFMPGALREVIFGCDISFFVVVVFALNFIVNTVPNYILFQVEDYVISTPTPPPPPPPPPPPRRPFRSFLTDNNESSKKEE